MAPSLTIDVTFDLICPWCLNGKRHLARALAPLERSKPDVTVQVRWLPVQLLPHLPDEGLPFMEFYVRRLGSAQAVIARQAQVNAAAAVAGFQIDFSRIARMPNTRRALRLLDYAAKTGGAQQTEALIERLFDAHFLQGRNIGDATPLVALAKSCGFDGPTVDACLSDTVSTASASAQRPTAPKGVPYFEFNGQYALAGAHPPEALSQAMQLALDSHVPQKESAAWTD
ncbi:MAG: DsbA family oxidoreductase [Rhodoferax sp.]